MYGPRYAPPPVVHAVRAHVLRLTRCWLNLPTVILYFYLGVSILQLPTITHARQAHPIPYPFTHMTSHRCSPQPSLLQHGVISCASAGPCDLVPG